MLMGGGDLKKGASILTIAKIHMYKRAYIWDFNYLSW